MDTELFVPYGLNPEGELVHARDAIRQVEYRCPECASLLVLRAGDVVARHFAHKANTSCTGESIAHETAKRLIAQVINEQSEASSEKLVSIVCPCACCHETFQLSLPPSSFSEARLEECIGSFRCDVVALRNHDYVLAIEILATHAVEEEKTQELSVPWMDISATAVLENPYRWVPTQSRLKPVLCSKCKTYLRRLNEVASHWGQPIAEFAGYRDPSREDYLAAIESCWKCKNDIIVYWWRGVPFCEGKPPTPMPKTIQHRYSKTYGGKYWANTCPGCSSIQGDNFLFLSEKAPFAGLPLRDLPQQQAQRKSAGSEFIKIMLRNFDV
jgi:Competence protein CoiA-like family